MTSEEARRILLACRPDTPDASDPQIADALALAKNDPELSLWLENMLETQNAFRKTLQDIQPPDELKARILEAHKTFVSREPVLRPKTLFAVAAVLAVMILAGSFFLRNDEPEGRAFADFRNRIVRTVIREYRMDVITSDPVEIQRFLRERQLGIALPATAALGSVPLVGAGELSWKGNPVAMVCFETEASQNLFLFAIDRNAVDAPPDPAADPERISHLETVSWSAGDKVFVLAGETDAGTLRQFL